MLDSLVSYGLWLIACSVIRSVSRLRWIDCDRTNDVGASTHEPSTASNLLKVSCASGRLTDATLSGYADDDETHRTYRCIGSLLHNLSIVSSVPTPFLVIQNTEEEGPRFRRSMRARELYSR